MSMSKEALDTVLNLHGASLGIDDDIKKKLLMPLTVHPKGVEISNLERYLPNRLRFRGSMNTTHVDSFSGYIKKRDPAGRATCFIDQEEFKAVAILNLGDDAKPGHADDTAALTLKMTSAFTKLLQINGRTLSQTEASEFIEEWRHEISGIDTAGESMQPLAMAKALRNLTAEAVNRLNSEVGEFKNSRSTMESVEIKAESQMPAAFNFVCSPYDGLMGRSFEVRISALTGRHDISLKYRILRLEAEQEAMAVEFKDKLQSAIPCTTLIGKFSA